MLYNTTNPHGGDIYAGGIALDFSANINPFGTPEGVKAAICSALNNLSYYPDPYCRELVSAIAEYENVPRSFILCGNGAAELIYSFARAQRPQRVVELAPTFAEYTIPIENAEIKRFYLREDNGFCLTDDFLSFIEKTEPNAVFLCNPNNPTGLCAPREFIEKAAEICVDVGAKLFVDECFMDLADRNESMTNRLSDNPHLIILKAFTKSCGMAGIRLGYCLCADEAMLHAMSRTVQPWNISTLAQKAGAAALAECDFLEKTRLFIQDERPRLSGELKRIGLTVFDSNANFLLIKGKMGLDERLMENGIKIRNCGNFHGLTNEYYRLAVKLPNENDRLIEAIKECL